MSRITLSGVCKRYPGQHEALSGISCVINAGELVAVTGPSGAGKSTLLKLMATIERPSSGTILINDQNVGALWRTALPFVRRHFGLVFQDHKLLWDRSVFANVLLPLEILGYGRRDAASRARAALDKVQLLHREKAFPVTLSGGEQQRLCIARAIVHRPTILLADEPTGNLNAEYARDIGALFREFHQIGVTVVIATHDDALVQHLQPRILAIRDGRIAG